MKTHHPKLKTTPCPLFSCGFFRHCTQTALSPTTAHPPPLPLSQSEPPPAAPLPRPPPPPPSDPPPGQPPQPESESSSSSTSQSFTQWRFPIPKSPLIHQPLPPPESPSNPRQETAVPSHPPPPPALSASQLQELFHVAELQLSTGSESERVAALHLLERSLVPNPPAAGADDPPCPPAVMSGVVSYLQDRAGAKPATKILLALCLLESNRHVAVEAGAVAAVVEAMADLEGAVAERALAALELMCTVAEGAGEVRAHALVVPMMVEMMGKMAGRGREYAISVLAVIYGGGPGDQVHAPPEEVAGAVVLALQGDCSARGRRKGAQLLKTLQDHGRPDLTLEDRDGR